MSNYALTVFAAIVFTVPLQYILQAMISVILPIIVGLVTKRSTHPGIKAGLLALLAAVTSGLTELLGALRADQGWDAGMWLLTTIVSLATAIALHYGLWKPTGTAARAQATLNADQLETGEEPDRDEDTARATRQLPVEPPPVG